MKIQRETVGNVHRSGCAAAKIPAKRKPRFGPQVALPGSTFVGGQAQRGPAQLSGNIDVITGTRSGPPQGFARWSETADRDVRDENRGVRKIAACKFRSCFTGQSEQTIEESVDPGRRSPLRERHGEKAEARFRAHRGDIAKSARKCFIADLGRRMRLAAEVHILNQHVRGEDEFLARGAGAKHGAIVPDPHREPGWTHAGRADFRPYAVDNSLFWQHGALYRPVCYSSLYMATRSVNKVILVGNLGRDAETKFTPGGSSVTKFSVATARRWKDQQSGEWKEETNWSNVTLWRAENLAPYLTKGKQVYVEGRLQTRSYEDKDGKKVYATDVVADDVILLGGRGGDGGGDEGGGYSQDRPVSMPRSARGGGGGSSQPPMDDFPQGITDDDVPF